MIEQLDELVARLAVAPPDRVLDNLDIEIGRSILLRRREARTTSGLAPVRVASVGLALAMGLTAGGAVAAMALMASPTQGLFSSASQLAPSTLLEGAR